MRSQTTIAASTAVLILCGNVAANSPSGLRSGASTAPHFRKSPATRAVISAGGGPNEPTFLSDPGVMADEEGLHLFASNLFCRRGGINGSWFYSWYPTDGQYCDLNTTVGGIGYAFSADKGQTWEYATGPAVLPGPYAWDAVAVETPFPRVVNDTLFLFYSARERLPDGKEFRARYQLGVATVALDGKGVRQRMIRDGALAAKRPRPLVSRDTTTVNGTTNNIQEPSAVWDGKCWQLFGIGLGLSKPAHGMDAPGQRIDGIFVLRWTYPDGVDALQPDAGHLELGSTTDAKVNIIEVHQRPNHDGYVMFYTTLPKDDGPFHHHESIGWAESADGLHWNTSTAPILAPSATNQTVYDGWGIMAPTLAMVGTESVLLYSAWQLQPVPCFPITFPSGRLGQPIRSDKECVLSNIGRAVSTNVERPTHGAEIDPATLLHLARGGRE